MHQKTKEMPPHMETEQHQYSSKHAQQCRQDKRGYPVHLLIKTVKEGTTMLFDFQRVPSSLSIYSLTT